MLAAQAGAIGAPPTLVIGSVEDAEKSKYEKMWAHDAYRNFSPGEQSAQIFLNVVKPAKGERILDLGCGTGRGSLMLALFGQAKMTMIDFARNCLDEDVRNALVTQPHALEFIEADLRKPLPVVAKYGYCTDVLEHIPPADVDAVIVNCLRAAQHVFFQISTVPDHFGQTIGEHLHLSVHDFAWWKAKLQEFDAIIHWAEEAAGVCAFYVSSWKTGTELVSYGVLNTENEELKRNVISSTKRGLRILFPHTQNEEKVLLLGGGPSLAENLEEIRAKRAQGYKLVTTNGAYNWAVKNGLEVSCQILVDAREFNKRFVSPLQPKCQYMLASQCAPEVFDAVPAEQTWLWHSALDEEQCEMLQDYHLDRGEPFFPIIGGSTVMLRAIPLLMTLGFHHLEIYGFDSCLVGHDHHAYPQAENETTSIIQVACGDRIFDCQPWMASQAQEFMDLINALSDTNLELIVHGDGLIAHIIQTAASLEDLEIKEN